MFYGFLSTHFLIRKMEEDIISTEKSQYILATLREHLRIAFPNLSTTLPLNQIRSDTSGNVSMVMPLRSRAEPTGNTLKGYITMGLPLDNPTFMLQFTPVNIVPDDECSGPSSSSLIEISVATYHGLILKKDFLTFYINFNNPSNLDEAELRATPCELLNKIEQYTDGFRLCAGLDSSEGLSINSVFIEPFGESRDDMLVVRSRKCEFMLELDEMFHDKGTQMKQRLSCLQCSLLQNDVMCIKPESDPNEDQLDDEMDQLMSRNDDFFEDDDKDPNWKKREAPVRKKITYDYSCDQCDKGFRTGRALERHKKNESCQKEETENKIDDDFESIASSPKKGIKSGDGAKKRKRNPRKPPKPSETGENHHCYLCFRDFSMPARFAKHMEMHKKRNPDLYTATKCPWKDCDLVLDDRIKLSAHFEDHSDALKPCAFCLKVIKKIKMRAHVYSDHHFQQFECQICNKMFAFKSHLRQHTLGNNFKHNLRFLF